MYTGRFIRQAPDRKAPPSASTLAALRLALGMWHACPPPHVRGLQSGPATLRPLTSYTVSPSQGRGQDRSQDGRRPERASPTAPSHPREEQAGRSSHARHMHGVSCKSLRGYCSQTSSTTTYVHYRTRRWRVASATGDLRLHPPPRGSSPNRRLICFLRAGFIEQPGTKNCAEQRIAILPCYRAMLSDAAVNCVSGSVCTVPETLHALYTMLLQENTPVLGKLFRPPWRLPESIRLCDNHTPDNWQAAIIRKLRHCWASFGSTCRHLHFRMTRIRKGRFCKSRNSASAGTRARQLHHY